MKYILLTFALTMAFLQNAQAYSPNTDDSYYDIPDYLGKEVIPLSDKEIKALRLTETWAKGGKLEPFLVGNGKLIYVHGASMPTILASPMQVCDIELQVGESVNEIIIGDSARWQIEKGQAGNVTHLFVKPIDAGLETSAVVTTNRRVYHLRFISSKTSFTPYVGFVYSDDIMSYSAHKQAEEARQQHLNSTVIDGQKMDLSDLNFSYKITGNHSWKPLRIYDDKVKTYIRFAEEGMSEMPILLVRKNDQNILVNYRVKGNTMIADGVFEEMVLVIGVGENKEEVRIRRD